MISLNAALKHLRLAASTHFGGPFVGKTVVNQDDLRQLLRHYDSTTRAEVPKAKPMGCKHCKKPPVIGDGMVTCGTWECRQFGVPFVGRAKWDEAQGTAPEIRLMDLWDVIAETLSEQITEAMTGKQERQVRKHPAFGAPYGTGGFVNPKATVAKPLVGERSGEQTIPLKDYTPGHFEELKSELSRAARECLQDVVSHYSILYRACEHRMNDSLRTGDRDGVAYWVHELRALERMRDQAKAALVAPGVAVPPLPTKHRYGDTFEYVLATSLARKAGIPVGSARVLIEDAKQLTAQGDSLEHALVTLMAQRTRVPLRQAIAILEEAKWVSGFWDGPG